MTTKSKTKAKIKNANLRTNPNIILTQVVTYDLLERLLTPPNTIRVFGLIWTDRRHKTINHYANCDPSGLESFSIRHKWQQKLSQKMIKTEMQNPNESIGFNVLNRYHQNTYQDIKNKNENRTDSKKMRSQKTTQKLLANPYTDWTDARYGKPNRSTKNRTIRYGFKNQKKQGICMKNTKNLT